MFSSSFLLPHYLLLYYSLNKGGEQQRVQCLALSVPFWECCSKLNTHTPMEGLVAALLLTFSLSSFLVDGLCYHLPYSFDSNAHLSLRKIYLKTACTLGLEKETEIVGVLDSLFLGIKTGCASESGAHLNRVTTVAICLTDSVW